MRKVLQTWTIVQVVVIIFIRHRPGHEKKVLMGIKTDGQVAGWLMPLGGHIKKTDLGYISAGHREAFEEGGLRPLSSRKVAELRVRVHEKRLKIIVHVTRCTRWTGKLKNKSEEFTNLAFYPLSKIPWHLVPIGEEKWMRRVLERNHRDLIVVIKCGRDRKDLKSLTVRKQSNVN